jgi:hypothetical protein
METLVAWLVGVLYLLLLVLAFVNISVIFGEYMEKK